MTSFAHIGKKLALTSLPLAFGSMLQKAYGQTPGTSVLDVLNFALTLEYLEYRFYQMALNSPGLIPRRRRYRRYHYYPGSRKSPRRFSQGRYYRSRRNTCP